MAVIEVEGLHKEYRSLRSRRTLGDDVAEGFSVSGGGASPWMKWM